MAYIVGAQKLAQELKKIQKLSMKHGLHVGAQKLAQKLQKSSRACSEEGLAY